MKKFLACILNYSQCCKYETLYDIMHFRYAEEIDNDLSLNNIAEKTEQINLSGYSVLKIVENQV